MFFVNRFPPVVRTLHRLPGSATLFAIAILACAVSHAQNNGPIYEAPFETPTGTFEWDIFTGSPASLFMPDITAEGGAANLAVMFTVDPDNSGPPFPLISSSGNFYSAGTFADYTADLSELDDSGQFTTVIVQLAAVGDAFSDFRMNGAEPSEFFNRGAVEGLPHGVSADPFDTTFYWVEWQLEGEGRDSIELTFSSIPHISLAGLRIDYQTSDTAVDVSPASALSLRGDFDSDGDVDINDLDQFIGQIGTDVGGQGQQSALDLNVDGIVGSDDFEEHFSQLVQIPGVGLGTLQGDINLDGSVDVLNDAFQMVSNLGGAVSSWSDGDVTGDGRVDVLNDAFALVSNLGMSVTDPQ